MIAYRKKFIRIVECWNDEEPNSHGADLTRRFQQTHPRGEMLNREFYTVLIDLNRDLETLFANMKRGTRYEIKRAVNQDRPLYEFWDGSDTSAFNEFCEYCDEFLEEKRQPKLDHRRLSLLAGARLLVLS